MSSLRYSFLGVALASLALVGCGSARDEGRSPPNVTLEANCTRCHGGVDGRVGLDEPHRVRSDRRHADLRGQFLRRHLLRLERR